MSGAALRETTATSAAVDTGSDRYLTFTLNGEAYALSIFHVTEILEYRQLTVVPMMPDFMRGVINLRGRAVPVVDLAIRFARGETAINRRTSIIIAHVDDPVAGQVAGSPGDGVPAGPGQEVGILVDAVNKVEAFATDGIEAPPAFGTGIRADYISGMARRDDGFIIILDVERVLSPQEMAATADAAVRGAGAVPATDGHAAPS